MPSGYQRNARNARAAMAPPFPAYLSGHAGLGGALFRTLRRFYRTGRIRLIFISEAFNGETLGHNQGREVADYVFENAFRPKRHGGPKR